MKRIIIYITLAIVIVGTGGYIWLSNSNSKEIKYRTEKVARGDITLQVRATGTLKPLQTVQVGSQVSGTLSKIYVDFNSEVRKGEIIALIDSTFLNASVKEAEANRDRNVAQLNEAKRNLNRASELFRKNLVSQADLDAATTAHEASQAQLKQSEAALERARVNLRYATIRAPIDGVVISRDVDVGQTVAASLQAPKLFEIANDLTSMRVEASVDEADIGQIKEGLSATFTVDSYPEEQFRGRVTQVRLAPVTIQNVVTYTVIIDVENPELKLRPGMTATVSLLIDKRQEVLRIPTLALRFQPPPDVLEKIKEQKEEKPKEKPTEGTPGDVPAAQEQPSGERRMERRTSEHQPEGERGRTADGGRRWEGRMSGGQEGGSGRQMWSRGPGRSQMARVWILEGGKTLKQLAVRTGLNDNRFVEILGDELKEGDEVVVSAMGGEMTTGPMQQSNPFQTRMPGGGGRGGRF